jgi:hypothetical protein
MLSYPVLAESLSPRRTALIVWDLQVGLAGQAVNRAVLAEQVPKLISGARAAGCRGDLEPACWFSCGSVVPGSAQDGNAPAGS